ncbi:YhcH/YjgK/YiaL family protein [Mucilaginibacter sp. BT774]|uniref:YhcH/YjgK/YiaL family protein n=1 Tax=Mucilaginibacter sp. BT774 TaxID=3062276 RepID=UPI0026753BD6|nr:YhcH/YjgK/YiaL family protein [Mucilaginibacter sp. BT774]MDO3626293.1 YhcH/YjgK/YiaL family protein [Mucilaginibacter sp. BT774]
MKILKIVVLLILFFTAITTHAQTDSAVKVKAAGKWVKSHEWAKDLKIKPDPSINSVEFMRQYESDKALWDKVFAFLEDDKIKTMAPGKYPIDGDNAYAMISAGPPKKLEDVKWESHRKYIDLQYVISGKVRLGIASVAKATVTEPYSDSRDAANYNVVGKYLIATPKEFFLFFPQDAHRPDIKIAGTDSLKKLVIKIRYKE